MSFNPIVITIILGRNALIISLSSMYGTPLGFLSLMWYIHLSFICVFVTQRDLEYDNPKSQICIPHVLVELTIQIKDRCSVFNNSLRKPHPLIHNVNKPNTSIPKNTM